MKLKPGDEIVLVGHPFTTYVVVGLSKVRPTEVFLVRSKQSGRLASIGPKSILEIVAHGQEVPQGTKACHEDHWIVE